MEDYRMGLGDCRRAQEHCKRGMEDYRMGLGDCRRAQEHCMMGLVKVELGHCSLVQGDCRQAQGHYRKVQVLCRQELELAHYTTVLALEDCSLPQVLVGCTRNLRHSTCSRRSRDHSGRG